MKKRFIIYIFSLLMLTGCLEKIAQAPVLDSAVPAMANVQKSTKPEISEEVLTTPPEGVELKTSRPIEVYEKVMIRDVISCKGVQLRNGSQKLDTSEIGEKSVKVSYIYKGKRYEQNISYNVSDTTAPTVLHSGDGSVVLIGESFDINKCVGFVDNYDKKPVITYTGEVDTSTTGTYYLTATAEDSSGNETTWDLGIKVEAEEPEYIDDNDRLPFEQLVSDYSDENVAFGIDVSKWQGEIDFEAVKNAGCEFVIMRVGSYYDEYTVDAYFHSNMENALNAGLKVGVYIYTTANTEQEVRENAQWIAEQLDGKKLDFPVVFDWEEFSNFQQYEMSINDLNEYYNIFDEELEKLGYDSMLYSSKNFLNNFWYKQSSNPVWLAHFTDETDYDGEYALWQMSCFGNIDGIEGDVDFNILYTDKAKFYE